MPEEELVLVLTRRQLGQIRRCLAAEWSAAWGKFWYYSTFGSKHIEAKIRRDFYERLMDRISEAQKPVSELLNATEPAAAPSAAPEEQR